MNTNNILNKFLSFISNLLGLNKYYSGMATIFMLHRVYPLENKLLPNERMKVSPEFLENFIKESLNKGFTFISLDELYLIVRENRKNLRKLLVITLDDGYKDNLNYAYPIFKKYNIPFTIYLTTSFPENKAFLWWFALEEILLKNDFFILPNNKKIICKSIDEKIQAFMDLRAEIIKYPRNEIKEKLDVLFSNYNIDWKEKCFDYALNWDEIIQLSKDSLCTIGGHTENHFALNCLDESEISDEINIANNMITKKINKKVQHFAYPFGSSYEVNEREFNIVKKMGFKTVTTTRSGNIFSKHRFFFECLPRTMLTEDFRLDYIGKIKQKVFVWK